MKIFSTTLDKDQIKMAKRWIKALRSGKYKQGRSALRPEDDQYCCLGVLCDVVDHKGWGNDEFSNRHYHQEAGGTPRQEILAEVGLIDVNPLIQLNDTGRYVEKTGRMRRVRFLGIAQFIERELAAATS